MQRTTLALILEDALRMIEHTNAVSDYMVREPVCAELWHPVSFVRQRMLTNSFSFLPVKVAPRQWCLVTDVQVAKYLQGRSNTQRKQRLATTLKKAKEIELLPARCVSGEMPIVDAVKMFDGVPLLVVLESEAPAKEAKLEGMLTAFDLL